MSLLPLVLSLFACYDPDDRVVPLPDPAPVLAPGAYDLQVYGVEALSCDYLRPADLIGQSVRAELALSGHAAIVAIEGFVLRGDMSGASLYAEGELEEVQYDVGAEERVDEGESDGASGEANVTATPKCDVEEGSEEYDCGGGGGGGGGHPGGFASLSATAMNAHLADGRLFMEMGGCAMDLDVAMVFVGPAGDDRPDRPTEEPPQDEPDGPRGEDDEDVDYGDGEDGEAPVEG